MQLELSQLQLELVPSSSIPETGSHGYETSFFKKKEYFPPTDILVELMVLQLLFYFTDSIKRIIFYYT